MGTEGPEALVAMGEAEVTCQHHLHMAPDGRTGVDPGSLGWRQTKERTGSEWPSRPLIRGLEVSLPTPESDRSSNWPNADAQGEDSSQCTDRQTRNSALSDPRAR